MNEPMANLPVTIFNFAMSPYENWQDLAWGASALIAILVLMLNIFARIAFREKTQS
jgi:phosphate transport system permease protein